jgi:hypothetical protein
MRQAVGRDETCDRLGYVSCAKFFLCLFQMESSRPLGDANYLADLPSRLSLGCPVKALNLASRQAGALERLYHAGSSARVSMEICSQKTEKLRIPTNTPAECRTTITGCEGDHGGGTVVIVNRDREAVFDPELRGFIKKLLFRPE